MKIFSFGCCRSGFIGGQGVDAECMNVFAHGLTERIIDQAVALQKAFAGKLRRDNGDIVVAAAGARAGMAGMLGALVLDVEALGRERRAQALFDLGNTVATGVPMFIFHGNWLLRG
jgi:hypothetical protein